MTTSAERWERARSLFAAARELRGAERAAFLEAHCVDTSLREEVAALLAADAALAGGEHAAFLRLDAPRAAALLDPEHDVAADPLTPGQLLGHYRIERRLGAGGMGVVYLAEDLRLGRAAALKLLAPDRSVDPAVRQRFEQEARAASALDHPHIVTVYEVGEAPDGQLFLAMAYCEGGTLRDRLARGPLPPDDVLGVATQIADGLAAAHRRGIIHRDIKPHNIVIDGDGRARITDFGIAEMTGSTLHAGMSGTPGTIAYMSPEQLQGASGDARSDVWAFGVLLHEMLEGHRPLPDAAADADSPVDGNAPARAGAPDDALVAALHAIVRRCLSPDPDRRYAHAGEVLAALRALPGSRAGQGAAGHPPIGRRPLLMAALALLVLVAGAVLLARSRPAAPRLEARRVAVGAIENRSGADALDAHASMAEFAITHGLWETGGIEVVALAPLVVQEPQAGERTLARAQGARLLVDGALYGDGEGLRMHARITDVGTGRVVGSVEPVQVARADATAGVDELRRRVQEVLYPQLDTQLVHIRAVQRPPRFEAFRAYLAGRDAHARRDLPAALGHFRDAAALDSSFALPRLTSAIVLGMMGEQARADSIVSALEDEAATLDAFTRAHVAWLRATLAGDRRSAHAEMQRAARLAPGSTLPNYQLADAALQLGRSREALDVLYAIEPERGDLRGWIGYWQVLLGAHHVRGEHRRELRQARRMRAFYADDPRATLLEVQALAALGRVAALEALLTDDARGVSAGEPSPGALLLAAGLELHAHAGRFRGRQRRAAAVGMLERAVAWYRAQPESQRGRRARFELATALWSLGRTGEAERELGALLESPPAGRVPPSPIAARATPYYPDDVAVRGALGVLAARRGDAPAAAAASAWLAALDVPYTLGRPTYWRAVIEAADGGTERAAALLEQAAQEGLPFSPVLHRSPERELLRATPRHRALLEPRD